MQAIVDAIIQGDLVCIQNKINQGLDVNTPIDVPGRTMGRTMLSEASRLNKKTIVEELLRQPLINVNQSTNNGTSPLYVSCYYGNIDIVRLLLQRPELDVNYNYYMTSLMITCHMFCDQQNDTIFNIIQLLLEHPDIDMNIEFTPDNKIALGFLIDTIQQTSRKDKKRKLKNAVMLFVQRANNTTLAQWTQRYAAQQWFVDILVEEGRRRRDLVAQRRTLQQAQTPKQTVLTLPADVHIHIRDMIPIQLKNKTSLKF